MIRTMRSCASVAVLLLTTLVTSAAAAERPGFTPPGERISLCGGAAVEADPAEYLAGELSLVMLDGCPAGQTACVASCCPASGCCDPTLQICCDKTCISVCMVRCQTCG